MKEFFLALLIVAAAIVVAMVAIAPTKVDAAYVDLQLVRVDGVECIVFQGYKKGGLSCDWAGAKKQ